MGDPRKWVYKGAGRKEVKETPKPEAKKDQVKKVVNR